MKSMMLMLIAAGLSMAANKTATFTGVITDSMCKKDHAMMKISPDSKCVQDCVKNGYKYALVVGDQVYRLSDQAKPAAFAAKKVTIKGTLYEKTQILTVDSIAAAK